MPKGYEVPMELRHLRYFVSVADTASVSKAALRIHISQPALSRQIRDLETELGVRLFDRVGRRIRLTPAGEELLERSRDVLARSDAMSERARSFTTGAAGQLRIGTTPQTMQSVIAAFLARYRRARPGVEVSLVEAGGVRLLDLLANGDVQIAVGGILAGARYGSRLLFPMHLLAVAAAERRWRKRSTIEVVELAHEPLLLLDRDFGTRQLFDAACRMAQRQPHMVLESTEVHSLVALAEAGQGIAVVPSTVRFMSRRIRVMPIVQEGKSLGTWGAVVWDLRRLLPVYGEAFLDELEAHTRHNFPGKRFSEMAPPLPLPPNWDRAPTSRARRVRGHA
jgi:LysR family cyn operon transcriptional activator